LTREQKIDELQVLVFAGHETTGTILSSIMTLFAKNPHVADKLRDELDASPSSMEHGGKYVPYFQYVFQESMCMMPLTAGGVFRQLSRDFAIPATGQVIPKGAICVLNFMLVNYNAEIFADPDSFQPERWATATKKAMKESMMPFVIGLRSCIGRVLATAEINTIVSTLVSNFDFSVAEEGELDFLTFFSFKDVKVNVQKRVR
jgi:cytochrome P450